MAPPTPPPGPNPASAKSASAKESAAGGAAWTWHSARLNERAQVVGMMTLNPSLNLLFPAAERNPKRACQLAGGRSCGSEWKQLHNDVAGYMYI